MRRLVAAALASAALVACKRDAPAPATTATPAPAPAATSATAKLSWFQPLGNRCQWVSQEIPGGERATLAAFDGTCDGTRVAWSPDRSRAVLWMERGDLVETGPGGGTRPAPPVGTLRDVGYDSSGALVALTLDAIPEAQARKGFAMADGAKLPVPTAMDGVPVLARAFTMSGGTWKRVETKVSDDAWDLATGVAALDAEKTLGARSWKILGAAPEGREATSDEAKALDAGCARTIEESGAWHRLAVETPAVFARLENEDFAVTLPPVCVLGKDGAAAPLRLDLDPDNSIAVDVSGTWMLISDSNGRRPHLVDLLTGKIAWSSTAATETVLWP